MSNISYITVNGTTYDIHDSDAARSSHTHTLSLATSTGTSSLSLEANTKYVLTAGGSTYIFTTPSDTTYSFTANNPTLAFGTESTIGTAGGTTYKVTMPAKPTYTYSDVGAASSSHTHTTSLATSTGTSTVTLAYDAKYALTAGGTSVIFTMPSEYTHPTYTANTAAAVKVGNDSTGHVVIGDALTYSDVGAASSGHTHTTSLATSSGTSTITLDFGSKYVLTAGGTSVIFTMPTASSGSGTVTNITAGTGLTTTSGSSTDGGSITTSGTLYLTKSGVTAGSYGASSSTSPGSAGTFTVPYITVDDYGRLTSASSSTITLPTTIYGRQTQSTSSVWRSILGTYGSVASAGSSMTSTYDNTSYYNYTVQFNPSTGIIYASGNYYMGLSTSDSLYTAINSAGWVSDVIV